MTKPLVMITGASAGIGSAVARRFVQEGYKVVLTARRQERLEALKKELGGKVSTYALDVQNAEAVSATINCIENEQGPIGILINNAGCAAGLEPAYEGKLEEWEQCVDTNIKGVLYCTRALLPLMVKRNSGHIVNIGSIASRYPYLGGNVYGATKAFIHQFSLNLRVDLNGTNVRVSCIEPGLTSGTEFSVNRFRGDVEKAKDVYKDTKPLQPEDIAEVIYFCCALPAHVNINTVEVMPVCQAGAGFAIHRS